MMTVQRFQAGPPSPDLKETLRYMSIRRSPGEELLRLANHGILIVKQAAVCRGCWLRVPIRVSDGRVELLDDTIESVSLSRHLEGCDEAYLMAATVGVGIDRLIRTRSSFSQAEGLAIDAAGSAAVEWVCDRLCDELADRTEGGSLRHRFSPGYGDFRLEFQKSMMKYLDMAKNCGITLSQGLMMTPTKSVTAIVGINHENNI